MASVAGPRAHADDTPSEEPSSPWELRTPTLRFTETLETYRPRIAGLPNYQQRLDGELELSLGNGTYAFRATPWGWFRQPDAQGGLERKVRFYGELKEAWVERSGTYVDFRIGNQILAWGAADQINPTDVWNPRDLYDPFQSPKLPLAVLDLKVHPPEWEHVSVELVATPFFRETRLPLSLPENNVRAFTLNDSRWFLPFPTRVIAGGGALSAALNYQVSPATYPSTWQGGARARITGIGGWDFSVSYANQPEPLPRFAFGIAGDQNNPTLPITATLDPSFHRMQMVGLDGAGSFGFLGTEIGVRFEAAYFFRDNSRARSAPAALQADLLRDDYVHVVAGLDYTVPRKFLGTVLYLNLQYVHYQRLGTLEQTPGRFALEGVPTVLPWDRDLVLYWEDRIGQNSQFKFLGTAIVSLEHGDVLLNPSVQYAWTDSIKTSLGARVFAGNPAGFFGQFHDNTSYRLGATLEL